MRTSPWLRKMLITERSESSDITDGWLSQKIILSNFAPTDSATPNRLYTTQMRRVLRSTSSRTTVGSRRVPGPSNSNCFASHPCSTRTSNLTGPPSCPSRPSPPAKSIDTARQVAYRRAELEMCFSVSSQAVHRTRKRTARRQHDLATRRNGQSLNAATISGIPLLSVW